MLVVTDFVISRTRCIERWSVGSTVHYPRHRTQFEEQLSTLIFVLTLLVAVWLVDFSKFFHQAIRSLYRPWHRTLKHTTTLLGCVHTDRRSVHTHRKWTGWGTDGKLGWSSHSTGLIAVFIPDSVTQYEIKFEGWNTIVARTYFDYFYFIHPLLLFWQLHGQWKVRWGSRRVVHHSQHGTNWPEKRTYFEIVLALVLF